MNNNNVTHPSHYQFNKPCAEVRDVINDRVGQGYYSLPQHTVYDYSNAIKYLLRAPFKSGLEDFKKAAYCIQCIIEKYTNESSD